MLELKPLNKYAVPRALEKAVRYRVLNEPGEAESICRDVLKIDEKNQEALTTLLLALTDQFPKGVSERVDEIWKLVERLEGEYDRAYYAGIVCERQAKFILRRNAPGCSAVVYEGLKRAMTWFDKAEKIRPEGNDDALLRWNSCVRLLDRHPEVRPEEPGDEPPMLLE